MSQQQATAAAAADQAGSAGQARAAFRDDFGSAADVYEKYRVRYPDALFQYLGNVCPGRRVAVDVGCGTGQATLQLAQYFDHVIGIDGSPGQVEEATKVAKAKGVTNVEFKVMVAEDIIKLADPGSIDLITVAQAIHWFNLDTFYKDVRTVLRPETGVLAAWTYPIAPDFPENPALAQAFRDFVGKTEAEGLWNSRVSELVSSLYAKLPFPFPWAAAPGNQETARLQPAPVWPVRRSIGRNDLNGMIYSWSLINRVIRETGRDPVAEFKGEFDAAWAKGGDGTLDHRETAEYMIHMRIGRNGGPDE